MKKIKLTIISIILAVLVGVFYSNPAYAEVGNNGCEVDTGILDCSSRLDASGEAKEGIEGTGLWSMILLVLNILTGGVGVAAVIGVIYGAALYTSAGGNSSQIQKASEIFTGIAYGIIAFAAMWSILNFLIPGGVFA